MNKTEELKKLLTHKKSRRFYAEKLSRTFGERITVEEVGELLDEIRGIPVYSNLVRHNVDKGEIEYSFYYNRPPTPEEIIKEHKIDTTKYKLSNFWSKQKGKGYQVSALFTKISAQENMVNNFEEFLKTYKSDYKRLPRQPKDRYKSTAALVLNKQDAHFNKACEYGTGNDIFDRFTNYENKIIEVLNRATALSNLERITYVIGSDEFNSEVTGATVRGTPQKNILNYHVAFELVCNHETNVIKSLLETSDVVDVVYLVGNHDACVSFHLASWLKVYFKDEPRVNVDINADFTKYFSIFDTAFCINHGDVQKPEKLAQNFPLEYKKGFAEANFHIILTGDKHHEQSKDIGGIKFYQLPAISKAKGSWDKQMGFTTTPAQMTSFLVEPEKGISLIFKETL